MLPLGTTLPQFSLTDVVSGNIVSSSDFSGKPLLVMFICRHCPYVKHVQNELAKIGRDYQDKIGVLAISPNDIEAYPEDAPDSLKEQVEEVGFTFPYLYDESQEVAKSFSAACTPDLFLFAKQRTGSFDNEGKLVYRGQLDDSRPGNNVPVTGRDLRAAIDALFAGQSASKDQKPSIGCSIKWKSI